MPERLLDVEDLSVHFATEDGMVRAVDGVSFTLDRGEVLGVVGRARKPITNVIDTLAELADQFLPGHAVAAHAASHQT